MNYKSLIAMLVLLVVEQGNVVAQIGIRTENVPANVLFIVDGAQDNPVTGVINATAQANDVVVDAQGRVGVGTHNPTAKLHIDTDGQAGMHGFRYSHAGILAGHALVYQADGTARWEVQALRADPVSAVVTINENYPVGSTAANPVITNVTGTNLPFTAPLRAGFFSFEIRFWANVASHATEFTKYDIRLLLRRTRGGQTTTVDTFRFTHSVPPGASGLTSTCTLYSRTRFGDVYNIAIEVLSGTRVNTRDHATHEFTKTKIRIIELDADNGVEMQ